MKKMMLLLCLVSFLAGCTVSTTPDSSKNTSYTLDSVNPR